MLAHNLSHDLAGYSIVTLKPARLQWSDNGDLESLDYGDVYFQRGAGFAESDYVFLQHNKLAERFAAPEPRSFQIAELGFGTGMNFLLTARLFLQTAPPDSQLVFTSIEKHPIEKDMLAQIYAHWPDYTDITHEILAAYPPMIAGLHTLLLAGGRIRLMLCFGDVADVLPELDGRFDAWFLDGFSPAKNPDMWQESLFPLIAARTQPGGTLATFSVAGHMRRSLAQLGFTVQKVKGFGIKWSMTTAVMGGDSPPAAPRLDIAVLGAGIAGCSAAYALARRGHRVTLIDKQGHVAAETSGNPIGVVYPKMTAAPSHMGAFHAHGFCYTRMLCQSWPLPSWRACGVTHLDTTDAEKERHIKIAERDDVPESYAHHGSTGLQLPLAGYLSPPEFCRYLSAHPNVHMHAGENITGLEKQGDQWHITGQDGQIIFCADRVVIALGVYSGTLPLVPWLPLQSLRGQISYIRPTARSAALDRVLCHDGYITPPVNGVQYIGATFQKEDPAAPDIRTEDHRENVQKLAAALPDLGITDECVTGGRTGYRAATPDRLPMIGPAPEEAALLEAFAPLRRGPDRSGHAVPLHDGLYISTGYGAHGMTGAPLGGEIIAAMIDDEVLPIPHIMAEKLAPARFLLRDLKRGKI